MPLRGPAEATEAMRGPAILAGEGAGANGFGDFVALAQDALEQPPR